MPADELDAFAARLEVMATAIGADGLKAVMHEVGVAAKDDVKVAVRGDIGDTSMSNWRRGRPIQIAARYDFVNASAIQVKPTPRSIGPMSVLESGRSGGVSKRGRRYSGSRGKRTWSTAVRLIDKTFPQRAGDALMKQLMKRWG
jgi:hypothetical protein